MKTRKFIGGTVATIGLLLAVCTADGSANEFLLRASGVALFIIGALLAQVFDFQKQKL